MQAMGTFTWMDWTVVGIYFAAITWVGHLFKDKQKGTHDFFLGGRDLPWFAVSASVIATAISGVTFIGVPSMLFAEDGNYTYMQFAIGAIIGKWFLGHFILPLLYKKNYYSPYEYIQDKLGPTFGKLSAILFFLGAILGQSVRVYAVALVLEVMTGLNIAACITIIIGFSVMHTWMGGIRAVVWTDLIQFFVFIAGGFVSIAYAAGAFEGGLSGVLASASDAGKTTLFNFALDKNVSFTFWAAIIGMPFQNLAAFSTDQLNTQRLLCCRSVSDARKALYWSNLAEGVTLLFLVVGTTLWFYFGENPLTGRLAELVAEKGDRVFPAFIVSVIPTGLKGLLIAGIFAAAMSSLDSVLAALSQTSVTMFHPGFNNGHPEEKLLALSRLLILVWGAVLAGAAWALSSTSQGLISLAFTMTAYTYGPMLGLMLLAMWVPGHRIHSLWLGVTASVFVVLLFNKPEFFGASEAKAWVAFPWLFPLGSLACVFFSVLPLGKRLEARASATAPE